MRDIEAEVEVCQPVSRGRDDHCRPPPAQIRTGAFNACGSCLGSWRRSEHEDTGGECVAAAATGEIAQPSAPNSAGASGFDGILRAATAAPTGIERRSASAYSPALHSTESSPGRRIAAIRPCCAAGRACASSAPPLMAWSLARIFFAAVFRRTTKLAPFPAFPQVCAVGYISIASFGGSGRKLGTLRRTPTRRTGFRCLGHAAAYPYAENRISVFLGRLRCAPTG